MKKKMLFGAFILCASAALGAEEDFFFEEGTVTQRLEESVITTERFETNVRNTPKNITIVTRDDIENKGAKSVIEALKGVPGVNAKNSFGFGSIDLRGQGAANHSNTLILVDGIRQNPADMGGARVNNIDIANVERIEVIPGGGSVLYGDGAVGGVVNIVTRTAAATEGYRSIFAEAGKNSLLGYGVNFGEKLTDSLLLQLNYTDRNNSGYRDNGDYDTENIEVGIKYMLSDTDTVSYKYGHYEEAYGLPGSLKKNDLGNDLDEGRSWTKSPRKHAEYITDSHTLSYSTKLNKSLEFMIDGNFKESDYDSVDKGEANTAYDNSQYMVKPKLKLSYGEGSHVILGYDYYKGDSKVKDYFGSPVDRDLEKSSDSVFALNTYSWKKFQFIQGVRYEKTDYDLKADQTLEPRKTYTDMDSSNTAVELAVNYLYSDTGSAYISYTNGFRTPNTGELSKASEDIKEQTHEYFEVGLKDVIFDSFVSASIFKAYTEDEIYYDKVNYVNTNLEGESEKVGVELFAEQYLGRLTLSETFTYIETKMQDGPYEGKEVPGVPKYSFNLGADYQFTSKFKSNTSINYVGESYYNSDFNNEADKMDDYITVDIKVAYDFQNGLEIYAGIDNIFAEEYYEYAGYYYSGSSGDNYYYYPAPERTYYAGFKYNF